MPRRAEITPRPVIADPVYDSTLVTQLMNRVMRDGKKSTAEAIVYTALDKVGEKTGRPPVEVLEQAVKTVTPVLEVKSRRVGGANYQVPVEVRPDRRNALATRWIITFARLRADHTFAEMFANEIMAASRNEGGAVKKREDTHKMAEANKAFAHYRW